MSVFYLSSIILVIVTFSLFIALHLKNKNYSIVANAVSDYAIGNTSLLFIAYVIAGIISYLCLLLGIFSSNVSIFGVPIMYYLTGIIICRIGLMIFKTDIEGKRVTLSGLIHYLFAIGSFTLMFLFVDSSISTFKRLNNFVIFSEFFSIYYICFAVSLALVCITMIPKFRKIFGLFERIYLILGNLWVGICSFLLFINTSAF